MILHVFTAVMAFWFFMELVSLIYKVMKVNRQIESFRNQIAAINNRLLALDSRFDTFHMEFLQSKDK